MICIYKTIPARRIRKEAKEGIAKAEAWFAAHPEKETATVGFWYGDMKTIRRSHVAEDVNAARDAALAGKR